MVSVPDGVITDTTTAATVRCERGREDPLMHGLDGNGWVSRRPSASTRVIMRADASCRS
jgi:hypothetical protein